MVLDMVSTGDRRHRRGLQPVSPIRYEWNYREILSAIIKIIKGGANSQTGIVRVWCIDCGVCLVSRNHVMTFAFIEAPKKVKKEGGQPGHGTDNHRSPGDDGVEFMDMLLRHQRRDEESRVILLLYFGWNWFRYLSLWCR